MPPVDSKQEQYLVWIACAITTGWYPTLRIAGSGSTFFSHQLKCNWNMMQPGDIVVVSHWWNDEDVDKRCYSRTHQIPLVWHFPEYHYEHLNRNRYFCEFLFGGWGVTNRKLLCTPCYSDCCDFMCRVPTTCATELNFHKLIQQYAKFCKKSLLETMLDKIPFMRQLLCPIAGCSLPWCMTNVCAKCPELIIPSFWSTTAVSARSERKFHSNPC